MMHKDSGGKKKLKERGGKAVTPYPVTKKLGLGAESPEDWEDQASKSEIEAHLEGEYP
ncbi:hypothetical protein DSO57_1037974 [Entomophthora muscae]|uniref:Uncharacterized protein n=1 Tax=Entomophthora muscae TaxID=34485 RepID=A0ACC2S163_9FUNG|nr:hypothetical protein DSO57_1037974 [Entomophthora muscae]